MTRRLISIITVAAFLLAIASPAFVFADDAKIPPHRKITSVEGITEYELGNGMKVLLFPDQSKPTVTVNITYFVGSRLEGYGETGMAHLLEHMVFKGTPDHPQIWKDLQNHGAQFNGTTSFDRTNYFETLAANDENLEFALKMEADRMVNSNIAKKDLDSEFSVVRNEFEMGENSPLNVLSERMLASAYLWHNYGKTTIGSKEDIERVPIDNLKAFYKNYYQPDNAMLVVAGKFDPDKTLKRINELFGSIPRPTRKLNASYTVEPAQDGEREVILRRVGDVQAVGALYHICSGAHPDMAALDVLEDILTANQTGRLYKALIEPQIATSVSGSAESLRDPGMMEFMVEARTDKPIDEVRKILCDTLDNIAKQDITEEEVERAKNRMAKQADLMMKDSGRVGIRLTESAAMGDWRLMFLHRDRVAKVTPADVKRVAETYLKPSNRTIGMFIPDKSPDRTAVPATPDLASMLKDYKGRQALAEGESLDATPAAIEARTKRGNLPFGMKTAFLPKGTRGDEVIVSLDLHYGSEADLKGRTEAAGFIGPMLMAGTSKHTKRQLEDEFDKLKANVSTGGGGGRGRRGMRGGGGGGMGTVGINIETTRQNLPAVLDLVNECLRESTFPEKEFEKMRKQRMAGIEQMMSEPMMLAMSEMRRRMVPVPPDDVRYVPTPKEQLEKLKNVKLDDVKNLYNELVGAGNSEVSIVGDFDASEVTNVLDNMFKNWKSPKPYQRIEMPYFEVKPEKLVINTPDKQNAMFALAENIPMRDDDPDYPALMMANYILGGNSSSRLLNRIRQKEGLSYTVGSNFQASSQDKAGAFTAFGICNPQNAEKAMTAALEEIDKLLKDGVTQKELDDARKGYFEQVKVGLAQDRAIAEMLGRQAHLGRTMKFTEEQLDKVHKLTVDDVNNAARKYLKPDKFLTVRAGDFEAKSDDNGEKSSKAKSPAHEKPRG